jgi:hypothetical protein
MTNEQIHSPLLLVCIAKNAYVNHRRMEVTRHIDIIDGNKPRVADLEFPANRFANFALQQFANALES